MSVVGMGTSKLSPLRVAEIISNKMRGQTRNSLENWQKEGPVRVLFAVDSDIGRAPRPNTLIPEFGQAVDIFFQG